MGFEIFFNIGMFLVLLVLFLNTLRFGGVTISTDFLGPAGFPQGVIVIALILLLWLISQSIIKKGDRQAGHPVDTKRLILTVLVFAVYIALLEPAGYLISTVLAGFSFGKVAGYKSTMKLIVFSIMAAAVMVLVFGVLFAVPLPRGLGMLRELSYYIY